MVRITPKEAQDMMNAYSQVHSPNEAPHLAAEPTEEPATEPEASTEE